MGLLSLSILGGRGSVLNGTAAPKAASAERLNATMQNSYCLFGSRPVRFTDSASFSAPIASAGDAGATPPPVHSVSEGA